MGLSESTGPSLGAGGGHRARRAFTDDREASWSHYYFKMCQIATRVTVHSYT